jgi:hypothetical protein
VINRNAIAAIVAALISALSSGTLYADTVATPVDLSANVIESILPGDTVFHDSKSLFGTTIDPIQSAELLHLSDTGVNASGRSTNISGAFASSLAKSDGNGGVGVSQLIFGSPGGSGGGVRKLVAQSLWTHTFVYSGPAAHDFLHLDIPTLQVGLLGVAPRRSAPSSTETAEADARVDMVITHPDGSMSQGIFEFEESIVAPLEAMCRALCRERIHPGHRVSRLEHAEIEIQLHGVQGVARVEVVAVEMQNGGEEQRILGARGFACQPGSEDPCPRGSVFRIHGCLVEDVTRQLRIARMG